MSYKCTCIKCGSEFVSEDESDFDGEAFCEACKQKNKEIAANIDRLITEKRKIAKPKVPMFDYAEARKHQNKNTTWYANR